MYLRRNFFIAVFERTAKIRKIVAYRFLFQNYNSDITAKSGRERGQNLAEPIISVVSLDRHVDGVRN